MAKIWEIDFTSFSGSVALDNVEDNNMPSYNLLTLSSLPDYPLRPGVRIEDTGTFRNFGVPSPGFWCDSYAGTGKRSFVMWFYTQNDIWGYSNGSVWGDSSNTTSIQQGFVEGSSGYLSYAYKSGSLVQISDSAIFASYGWHLVVATIDIGEAQQKVYLDGNNLKATISGASNLPYTSATYHRIGNHGTYSKATFDAGYVATYDHILSPTEIQDIYDQGMANSPAGEAPIQTISGTVYGLDNLPISGANVYLVRDDLYTRRIDLTDESDLDGRYSIDVDLIGNYLLVSSNLPNAGSIVQPLIVTTSGVTYL